ncbi:MAG TPA: divalent-cation tolerance protein CutA [Candidatus Binataceae bacterium]|nr:divalent-cation tolerance protein CutA [Candidatus Binataceae bacterium]
MAAAKESYILVFVTTTTEDNAAAIGRALVEERLAACANLIGPIRSIYRWQDVVEDGAELLLMIKTRSNLFPELETRIKELHPYEVPEILAVNIEQGSAQYLDWLHDSTVDPSGRKPRRSAVSGGQSPRGRPRSLHPARR